MELNLQENLFCTNKSIFNSCQEASVNLEINLPDYCTDISKILKCSSTVQISSKSASGNRVSVDGDVVIDIIYCDNSDMVKAYKTSTPFSKIFESSDELTGGDIKLSVCNQKANVRPLSSRKIDVNASFKICLDVMKKDEIKIISNAQGGGVETKTGEIIAESYICSNEKLIILDENIALGEQKPPINSILRYETNAKLTDTKLMLNKMIVKGEMSLKVLYESGDDASTFEEIEEIVPFSQIVELDGADEDCVYSCNAEIQSVAIREKSDAYGDNREIAVEIIIMISAECRKPVKLQIVTDAYSTECELEMTQNQENFIFVGDRISDSTIFKKTLEMPVGEISSIDSLWVDCDINNINCKDDTVTVTGILMASILGKDDNKKPFFAERPINFEYRYKAENSGDDMNCKIEAIAKNVGYTLQGGNNIEVRCEVEINGEIVSCVKQSVIESMKLNEDKKIDKSDIYALTLYFADNGENVWEIAKKYSTSANAIKRDNGLNDDIIETASTLLISSK